MAFNGKYVNIEFIVERLYTDYGFDHKKVNYNTIIEWVYDAIVKIGVPQPLIDKITDGEGTNDDPLEVEDYTVELPRDVFSLEMVINKDDNIPMVEVSTPFNNTETLDSVTYEYSYKINGTTLITDIEDGEIIIIYKAIPTDSRGYPLIADNVHYIDAVIAFIAEKIAMRMLIMDQLSSNKYNIIKQRKNFAMGAAKVAIHTPTISEMEAWKRRTQKLYARGDYYETYFKDFYTEERLRR